MLPKAHEGLPSRSRTRLAMSAPPSVRLMPIQSQRGWAIHSGAVNHSRSSQAVPVTGDTRPALITVPLTASCGTL
jgi:hypothetical protein